MARSYARNVSNLCLRTMKRPRVSKYYDINMMGVVEHERSLRETRGVAECFSDFSSTSRVFISQYIDTSSCFILLLFKFWSDVMCKRTQKVSFLWYRAVKLWRISRSKRTKRSLNYSHNLFIQLILYQQQSDIWT
jgi:hypothetical protein